MRLNIRLIGILHGITIIGLIGYYLLHIGGRSRTRRSKDSGAGGILALGIGLLVIGYTGTFFGNLIKAAVSRRREFLADASAVQYTRNPDGIAGALKRIGGDSTGSIMENAHTAEISHALFSQGISGFLAGLFATHPPLGQRIQRVDPRWDGKFDFAPAAEPATVAKQNTAPDISEAARTAAILATAAAAMGPDAVTDSIGQPALNTSITAAN